MNREQVRRLLGGYATDTLTAAERRSLFEAALNDQELFDELAGEQALRDLLREPQARRSLIETLETHRTPAMRIRLWRPASIWAAGALAAGLLTVAVLVQWRTPPPAAPLQMAAVRSPAPPPIPRPVPAAQPKATAAHQVAARPAAKAESAKAVAPPPPEVRFTPMAGLAPLAGVSGYLPPQAAATDVVSREGLSLRYSILLGNARVPQGTAIHAGDALRLSVTAGEDGYLYVLERASAGGWQLLFGGKVEAGKAALVPSEGPLRYAVAGRRTWLAVLSHHPQPDVENLVAARLDRLVRQARGTTESVTVGQTMLQAQSAGEVTRVSKSQTDSVAVEIPIELQP